MPCTAQSCGRSACENQPMESLLLVAKSLVWDSQILQEPMNTQGSPWTSRGSGHKDAPLGVTQQTRHNLWAVPSSGLFSSFSLFGWLVGWLLFYFVKTQFGEEAKYFLLARCKKQRAAVSSRCEESLQHPEQPNSALRVWCDSMPSTRTGLRVLIF